MVHITDHAVIRFLERRYGFSFESTRIEMHSEALDLAVKIGCDTVISHGGKMVIRDDQVVTFLPKEARQTKRRLRERDCG